MNQFLSSTNIEFAHSNSEDSLQLMLDYQIPPTPENYQLWYTHTAQSDLNLSRVIDNLVTKKAPFDEKLNHKLYEKFFSREDETKALTETGVTFQKEVAKIVSMIKEVGENTSNHSAALSQHVDSLSDFEGASELKDVIKLILNDTNKIKEQSDKLEGKLMESSSTISELQNNLDNARLESRTDALTNIGNRKFFDEKLLEMMQLYKKEKQPFSLIIGDIDHFKKFNDTFGHQIGDQVLKVVAHVLKTESCDIGFPARYGGEEFAILLPDTDTAGAMIVADQIRKLISHKTIKNKNTGQNFGKITMSLGVAKITGAEPAVDLITRADAALYLAKENGRNRIQSEFDLESAAPEMIKATA